MMRTEEAFRYKNNLGGAIAYSEQKKEEINISYDTVTTFGKSYFSKYSP